MSRERALKIRELIEDVVERQAKASPQVQAMRELMPEAFAHFVQHVSGNASMAIDCALDAEEL